MTIWRQKRARATFLLALAGLLLFANSAVAQPRHAIAMHGAPKHGPAFKYFSYVNPDAPVGGTLKLGVRGSFDSLNPLTIKGEAGAGVRHYVYESLMGRALDEPFSLYGLLAESIETPDDRSWVAFTLRPEARFSDGAPVTIDDVIFSHAVLRDKGRPNHRFYYSKVAKVEKTGPRTVRFTFGPDGDREMPLILGLMPILPKHAMTAEKLAKSGLDRPLGSGPYLFETVDPGKRIVYRRNRDYWGWHLPVNKGRHNFERVAFQYFRDRGALFEAFKKGLVHVQGEADPSRWSKVYDFAAVKDGRITKAELDIALPAGMLGLVFNTRRAIFKDPAVRQALILLFDFEWMNRKLFFGLYERTQSFFARSELSSHARPASARERQLLAPYLAMVKPEILAGTHSFAKSDGRGRNRKNLRKALKLFTRAGYVLRQGRLVNESTGRPFTFEILAASAAQEKVLLTYSRSLARAGIKVSVRLVDSAQYQRRKRNYDFDMIQTHWRSSLSPGNEQSFRWAAKAADTEGTFNYAGVKSQAVDAMIGEILKARSRKDFVAAVRALDRLLLSGDYVVPLYHLPKQWVAYWSRFKTPRTVSLFGYQTDSWWLEAKK